MLLLFAIATPATAQQLTVERIFGSDDFTIRTATVDFTADGERALLLEQAGDAADLWVQGIRTEDRERLIEASSLIPPGATRPIQIEGLVWADDQSRVLIYTNSQRVWRLNTKGLYYIFDFSDRSLRPISAGDGWQMFAKFSPDGRQVAFVRDNDLFVTDLETGRERRLTTDGSEDIINGTTDWVYEEELDLRDAYRWSPDGRRIAFWRFDQSPIPPFFMIDELDLYSEPVAVRYPKAGTANSRVEIRVIDLQSGAATRIDTGEDPEAYLARMEWTASPNELVIQRLNRHQNRIDVLLADATTGESRLLFSEQDSAWVDVDDEMTWIGGGNQFLWSSERDGYNHLYLYNRDGSVARQLTSGEWDVTQLHGVDEERGLVYFNAAREGPLEDHLYRVRLNGSGLERITTERGAHSIQMSPNFAYYVDTHSRAGVPPVTRLHSSDGAVIRTLAENAAVADRLEAARLNRPEFFTFRTSDGVELNAWMIKPPDFDERRRYPVLMYVYGGPGSQTVIDAWGGSRYLWHQLLAERGFVVVSVDNRGTGSRGRDFKKVTYLNLGHWETHDQIEAARHLATLPYVDRSRIGIWGWSYGGYMTLLAMANGDVFRAGVSVAPVTDWRLYDTIYTERFMRTPHENERGYDESSPVRKAERITGDLLLVHGTADDNVHFQNSTQLVNALIDAKKPFDFMMYPNRTHGISGGNTSVHLFDLMTRWLEEHLAGPAPRATSEGG